MKTNPAEKELQTATGVKRRKDEPENEYLLRLLQGVADLPEASWSKLSEPAQAWFNAAAEATNAGSAVVGFVADTSTAKPIKPAKTGVDSSTKAESSPRKKTAIDVIVSMFLEGSPSLDDVKQRLSEEQLKCSASSARLYFQLTSKIVSTIRSNS